MIGLRIRRRRSGPRDLTAAIQLFCYAVLLAGAVIMILPFLWMTSTACKPPSN